MNWFKENPFLAGLIGVAVLVCGGLGYFVFDSWNTYSAAAQSYTDAVTKLHTLQNKAPFPSEENLKAMQAAFDEYSSRITELRTRLSKMESPLDMTVTPQRFQDDLRQAVNEVRERAAANGVKLPEKFYLGFDQYQSQVPSDVAAPYLNRQLGVIRGFVNRLVELRAQSVDGITRQPLAQEGPAAAAPPPQKDPKQQKAAPVFVKSPFQIAFTAEQSKFRVAFNALLGSDQFLIVRSLSLVNSAPQAPSKVADPSKAPAAANPFAAPAAGGAAAPSMQVILGRETVHATLWLEILNFPDPAAKG